MSHRTATVLAALLALAGTATAPALAHDGGLVPYRYAAAPPGVESAGTPADTERRQPINFGGITETPDQQVRLTLGDDSLAPQRDEQAVTVTLEQLDPASLPALPQGQEAEGNAYRVSLVFSGSGAAVGPLAIPGELRMAAPATPSDVLLLVDDGWRQVGHISSRSDGRVLSLVALPEAGTYLQVYEPDQGLSGLGITSVAVAVGVAVVVGAGGALAARSRRRGLAQS